MTSPVPHGYTDYGRTLAQADKLILSDQVVVNLATTYPRVFVGDYAHLGIYLRPDVQHHAPQFRFYDAASGGNLVASWFSSVRETTILATTVPTGGPYMEMEQVAIAYPATLTRRLWLRHSPVVFPSTNYNETKLITFNANIGAGASMTFTSPFVHVGQAHWFTESAVSTWTSRVETIDYAGTAEIIDEIRKTAAGDDGRLIFLPPINTQIVVTNSSAGAGTFRGALVARPLEPGR